MGGLIGPHRVHEMQSIAIDDPIICQSVCMEHCIRWGSPYPPGKGVDAARCQITCTLPPCFLLQVIHMLQVCETCVQGDNTSSQSSAASHSPTSRWRDTTSLDATSEQERTWRSAACDYELRFCGHCNTTTDIKEANFFGRLDISGHFCFAMEL